MSAHSLHDILPAIGQAKTAGKTIVLATGVFDILHQEHVNFLKKAKTAGSILIVALETDRRVKAVKGEDRPIHSQEKRMYNLKNLDIADYVILLPEQFDQQADWENFINQLRPDIYAVSSHTKYLDNKRYIMEKFGGRLQIVHRYNPNISTTKMIHSLHGKD